MKDYPQNFQTLQVNFDYLKNSLIFFFVYFVVYNNTSSSDWMIGNNELWRVWKEKVVAKFNLLSSYLSRKNWEIPQNKSEYAIRSRYLQNIITHLNCWHDMEHVVLKPVYKSVYSSHYAHFFAEKRKIIILQICSAFVINLQAYIITYGYFLHCHYHPIEYV